MDNKLREDYILKATTFLQGTVASPITKRISFLEARGLTSAEILESLKRCDYKTLVSTVDNSKSSWIWNLLVPGFLAVGSGVLVYLFTSDSWSDEVLKVLLNSRKFP